MRVRQRRTGFRYRPSQTGPLSAHVRSTSPPPLSFSFTTSNNSSRISLPSGVSPISHSGNPMDYSLRSSPASAGIQSPDDNEEDCETPGRTIRNAPRRSSKKTDKAVAALSLALANGAGSVSDYEALRGAQDALEFDNSEAGNMWD